MYKKIIILVTFLLAVNFIFSLSLPALAMSNADDLWGGQTTKQYIRDNSGLPAEPNSDPRIIAARLIRFFLGFLGVLAVVIIIYAGFKWMSSGGSEDKISDAKKMLIAALIGFMIIIFAYAIATFVINQLYDVTSG